MFFEGVFCCIVIQSDGTVFDETNKIVYQRG